MCILKNFGIILNCIIKYVKFYNVHMHVFMYAVTQLSSFFSWSEDFAHRDISSPYTNTYFPFFLTIHSNSNTFGSERRSWLFLLECIVLDKPTSSLWIWKHIQTCVREKNRNMYDWTEVNRTKKTAWMATLDFT